MRMPVTVGTPGDAGVPCLACNLSDGEHPPKPERYNTNSDEDGWRD